MYFSNIYCGHLAPGAGAMGAAFPEVQLVANPLVFEDAAQATVVVEEGIGFADGQDDVELTQFLQPPLAGEARQEMRGRVEIDFVVVIAVEQVVETLYLHRQVIATGKGHKLAEEMGMSEHEARGLEGAEAAAHLQKVRDAISIQLPFSYDSHSQREIAMPSDPPQMIGVDPPKSWPVDP